MIPKVIKTEQDIDMIAKFLKEALKKAGQEGINIVHQFSPDSTTYRSELRFTFEHRGITFSGCLYEPDVIGTILRAILNTVED